jgi:hypothetical protein
LDDLLNIYVETEFLKSRFQPQFYLILFDLHVSYRYQIQFDQICDRGLFSVRNNGLRNGFDEQEYISFGVISRCEFEEMYR